MTYVDGRRIFDATMILNSPLSLKNPGKYCFYMFIFIIFGHIYLYSTVLKVLANGFSSLQQF